MKTNVYDMTGKATSQVELPAVFDQAVDETLIKRAVLSIESAGKQAYGPNPMSNRKNTALYIGARHYPTPMRTINTDKSRKPRLQNRRYLLYGKVAGISGVVGGPKAHAPEINKTFLEQINEKEKQKATRSAIAATAKKELVKKRGHHFDDKLTFPIVISDDWEGMKKTKDIRKALESLGVEQDVEKAKNKKETRAGVGKKRGRRYQKRKSILFVYGGKKGTSFYKACRNLEGVDVTHASHINCQLLAPGAKAGRLTVFTQNALNQLVKEGK